MDADLSFSHREALSVGWSTMRWNLKPLLAIGAVAALLALLDSALMSHQPLAGLMHLTVQVAQTAVALVYLRAAFLLHDSRALDLRRTGELLAGFFDFLITTMLVGLIVAGGMVLLIVPGIYLAVRFGFAPFLVAERGLDPLAALHESSRLTDGIRWHLFAFGVLLSAINFVGALTLGIGLFVTVPTSYIAAVHVYRILEERAVRRGMTPIAPQLPSQPILPLVALALVALLAVACAPAANDQVNLVGAHGAVAGFWLGLWHGIIAPITFVISLFSSSVSMYEVHNSGGWYDLGFLLGFCSMCGGGGAAGRARRSTRARLPVV